jgi:organic hydroperoxide reductase OsmC/OhrA
MLSSISCHRRSFGPPSGWDRSYETGGTVKIRARVQNSYGEHHATMTTNGTTHPIDIPPRASGFGSSANGGELLFLALATCYCNDIYREAAKRGIEVEHVEVDVEGQFGAEGEPATHVTYRAKVVAHATKAEIRDLMQQTDTLAEVQNTLRVRTPVTLDQIEAVAVLA